MRHPLYHMQTFTPYLAMSAAEPDEGSTLARLASSRWMAEASGVGLPTVPERNQK